MKTTRGRTAEQLWKALESSELKRGQQEKMIKVLKDQVSQLESIILTVRNAVTPRGDRVFSEDITKERQNGSEV